MFGNRNVEIETGIRIENSSVVEHVRPINSVKQGRRSHVFLSSNMKGLVGNPWLALSHIAVPLNIPDEMTKASKQTKLILLLSRNIYRTMSEKVNEEIRRSISIE